MMTKDIKPPFQEGEILRLNCANTLCAKPHQGIEIPINYQQALDFLNQGVGSIQVSCQTCGKGHNFDLKTYLKTMQGRHEAACAQRPLCPVINLRTGKRVPPKR